MNFNFVLSADELIFIGWFLGILEAKLVKRVPIDWSFALFNLIVCIVFWFCFELFIIVEAAKSVPGQAFQVVVFLALGYGVYKVFQITMKTGLWTILKAIPQYFKGLVLKMFGIKDQVEKKEDEVKP